MRPNIVCLKASLTIEIKQDKTEIKEKICFVSVLSQLCGLLKGAIASKMKHVIQLKTSPARLAQLL